MPLEEKEENLPFPYDLDSPCPDLSEFNFVKVEDVYGVSTTHYAMPTVTFNVPFQPDAETSKRITVAAWEYWIDSDGVILQAKNTTDGFVNNEKLVEVVTFSGFGEFNVIEDPMPDGTPTPTPAPTEAPIPSPRLTPIE